MKSYHKWLLNTRTKLTGVRKLAPSANPLYRPFCQSAKQDLPRLSPSKASRSARLLAYICAWVSRAGVAARRKAGVAPARPLPAYLTAGKSVTGLHGGSK